MLRLSQEKIVALITGTVAIIFALLLPDFISLGNLTALARSMTVLGVFALGMAVVVIGRGVDLSQVAIALVATGAVIKAMQNGVNLPLALLFGFLIAISMGALNGFIIAVLRVSPLFATLASAVLFVGVARITFLDSMIIHLPQQSQSLLIIGKTISGIPVSMLVFIILALFIHIFLSYTVPGKYIYAVGSNPLAARMTGLPVKRIVVMNYVLSAAVGFVAGLMMVSTTAMVDLKSVGSTLIFDILVIVILGGITLTGGRGGVPSVLAGTLMVGVLFNGMTILDLNYQTQNIIKGAMLLIAIVLDGWLGNEDRNGIQQGI